ncbi:MAG: ThiF family adenylyltransferase [Polyangiaceae bacterium]
MSLSAREENAKTLASVFGLDEDEAWTLLDVRVGVRAATDARSQAVRRHVVAILGRTVSRIEEQDHGAVAIEIVIGPVMPVANAASVRVGITTAEVVISSETEPAHDHAANVPEIVLLLAACYAAAMAVRISIGAAFSFPHHNTIRLPMDLLLGGRRHVAEGPIEIGRAYLAGAGAVSNGFIWALATFDARGELHVVDPKNVSSGNLGRCLWFEAADVEQPKAERLAERARASLPRLKLVPRVATVQTLAERNEGPWLGRLVVGVDSRRARRRLQEELPGEVFDASTTGIEEVVVHVNSARESGACLSCIYHEDVAEAAHEQHVASMLGVEIADVRQHYVSESAARRIALRHPHLVHENIVRLAYDTLFKTMCATGQLGVDEARTVLAPLAFVSVLAGAYLALEFVCRTGSTEIVPPFNYWRASPWTSPVFDLRVIRSPRAGCETCGNEVIRATVRSLWGTYGEGSKGPI